MPELRGVIGPSYRLRSQNADCEQAINLYTERIESGSGKEEFCLRTTPGLLEVFALGTDARVRGMLELNDHVFAVIGTTVYDFITDGLNPESWTINASYGPVANDGNAVTMAANRDSLVIVSVQTAYTLNAGVLSVIAWLPAVLSVGYINTFFVFLAATFDGFYYSEPDDPTSGDVSNFVSAEASANNFTRLVVDHQQVVLFGNRIIQIFQTTGDDEFPFEAVLSSGVIQQGIDSVYSAVQANNRLYFVGGDALGRGIIWGLAAYTPLRVSDHGVEYAIRTYAETADCVGWAYQEDGHIFVVFSFITEQETWCLDLSTGHWHRRAYWNQAQARYEAHRGYCATAAFGNVYVGDRENGKIYRMSLDYTDDDGEEIRWQRTSPDYANQNKRIQYRRVEFVVQAGFGGTMSIRWSNDNGYTWSNEYQRSLGATGEYGQRVFINNCGQGRNRVWDLSGTGQVVLVAANAEVKALMN